MTHTDIHVRSRSDAKLRSESYAAATRRRESRASTTRALPLNFSHRTRLRSTSARGSRTLFYFIAVSQILLVTTASTTRQLQDDNGARNQTAQPQLSSYHKDYSTSSTSTIPEPSTWSVPAPEPTPLRSAATKRSLYLSSSSSSSSSSSTSLSASQTTSLSVEESTLLAPLPLTAAMPPSKLVSPSSYIRTSTSESTTQVERRDTRTAEPNTSQLPSSLIPTEYNDLDGRENPDNFVATQTFRKRDLVYLKHQMIYQRQEIQHLRFKLRLNDIQMTGLQREFHEFRKQQLQARDGGQIVTSSTTGKDTQTTSPTLLLSSPGSEPKSTNPCLECSKSELRLVNLQREFESFQKKVNATFNDILIKLALLNLDSPEVPEVAESLKPESVSKIQKYQVKPADDKSVTANGEVVSRKLDVVKNEHGYDAIIVAVLSKQRTRSRTEEEEENVTHGDLKSTKHHDLQKRSREYDSDRKADHKEKTEITKEEVELEEDGSYRFSDDLTPELESINEKVQLVSDNLEELADQLMSVKENTSLSIKYLKDTLRGNISLLESYINQLRTDDERRESDEEKTLRLHTLTNHTIKESGQRSSPKKNGNGTKEKEHPSTSQKEKTDDPLQSKTVSQTRDVTGGGDASKFPEKGRFQPSAAEESVHRNFSWLVDSVETIQYRISNLDSTVSELSSTLSKLAIRFPFEIEPKNETIDKILSAATEKSTSDHLSRLLNRWPTAIRDRNPDEKGYQNRSLLKEDQQLNAYDMPEQETNSSQGISTEKILAVNQSEQWKSGSQMISDSAEQFPEATHNMLKTLVSWINDLDAQIKKLKMAVAGMKTRIMYMLSMVEQLYTKDTETETSVKDEAVHQDDDSLASNSTQARTLQTRKGNALPPASSAPSLTTSISHQPTTSTAPLTNISDIHERFLGNRSTASFENSGVDMPESITQNYQHYKFTELDSFDRNKSITTPKVNLSTADDPKEWANPPPTNVRITVSRTPQSKEIGSLETALGNVQDLLKRVKKLESQVLDLSEDKLLDANESGLHIQTDYPGSGTTEDAPIASLEMVNKITLNMSRLQGQIFDIKRNMTAQENQLNSMKNDVFILDERLTYQGKELSDLEMKQRRDDRYYYSQQINEANLSLVAVADQVSQILAPKQQLANQNLKELNNSLNMQWTILNRLKEKATRQETNISRISQNLHISQEKILYVDLSKRRYRLYNSTSAIVNCNTMKDADRTFLNKKTQTCYYGYGYKNMLPYNAAKRKCEDAGLHIVFMETEEERKYVSKEISQEIGAHWIGMERFDYGWYWVRGCDAVDPVIDPPWRYNHSVKYSRAIIWGDKWSGKYPGQHCRFVCEEEPFKEEICNGFRSFERVNEWSSDAFFRSFNTLHEVDCGRLCLADPSCKGFRFRKSGHHKCALYNSGNTTTKKKTTCDAPGEMCYIRTERCFS